jgi:hypothetical protein
MPRKPPEENLAVERGTGEAVVFGCEVGGQLGA